MLEAGRLYVIDRGCAEYALFQGIIDAQSSFVGRLCSDAVLDVIDEREISPEAKAAGVVKDVVAWVGSKQSRTALKQPLRVVSLARRKTARRACKRGAPRRLAAPGERASISIARNHPALQSPVVEAERPRHPRDPVHPREPGHAPGEASARLRRALFRTAVDAVRKLLRGAVICSSERREREKESRPGPLATSASALKGSSGRSKPCRRLRAASSWRSR